VTLAPSSSGDDVRSSRPYWPLRAPLWSLGLAWAILLGAAVLALERSSPLLLNLGAGDAPYARGFRGGWERDGLTQSGDTEFHWTLDGARLEFPLEVGSGRLRARLRLARFASTPAEMTLLVSRQEVDHFHQPPHGWTVREVDLGEVRGPLSLQFRSRAPDGDPMGVALDWVEVSGAGLVFPRAGLIPGLALFLLGLPLFVGLLSRNARAGLLAGCLLALLAAFALLIDRLGGLVAVAASGLPGLLLLAFLAGAFWALGRLFPETPPFAAAIPVFVAFVALLALFHPFYYYPDVDTHARFVSAIRARPFLVWDPTEFQLKEGTWTRQIGGARVAFPYSPAFHLLALPLAPLLGDVSAVKLVGISSFALTLGLVFVLARVLGLGSGEALLAQLFAALLPVGASRLALALYPGLLGEAAELFLVVFLLRAPAFGTLWVFVVLVVSQLAYVGSLANVGAFLGFFVAFELVKGDRPRALRLVLAWALSAACVFALLDLRFVPTLFRDVLPHLRESSGKGLGAGPGLSVFELLCFRLAGFFDLVAPLLALLGIRSLSRAPAGGRHMGLSLLLGGAVLLALRVEAPALFQDVKDAELLLPIVSVLASAGLFFLLRRGLLGRLLGIASFLEIAYFGLSGAARVYAERFLAVGR
jgi:hypothetical protein